MKKMVCLLLTVLIVLSLAGCIVLPDDGFTFPTDEPTGRPTAPQQTDPALPPQTDPTLPPQTDPTLPPQTDPTLPPQTDPTLPPQTDPTLPPQTDPTVPPQTDPPATKPTNPPATKPTTPPQTKPTTPPETEPTEPVLDPDGSYTTKEDVALYIHLYGKLPSNFITKNQARNLGWKSGSLERYAPGKCIGGDRFGNREGLLPTASGRYYTECDIGTLGSYSGRGSKRIVFSNDGLIYYTDDHYESFTLLYGEE